jgi:hypothetical protein
MFLESLSGEKFSSLVGAKRPLLASRVTFFWPDVSKCFLMFTSDVSSSPWAWPDHQEEIYQPTSYSVSIRNSPLSIIGYVI